MLVFVCTSAGTSQPRSTARGMDPEIQKMIREVSAKNIEASIRKLVSFGTRNTLSEQDNPTRGIGAARDWIYAEFQRFNVECGGCLIVEKQSFTQPKAGRIPEPTVLTNVIEVRQTPNASTSCRAITIRCVHHQPTPNAMLRELTMTHRVRRQSSNLPALCQSESLTRRSFS